MHLVDKLLQGLDLGANFEWSPNHELTERAMLRTRTEELASRQGDMLAAMETLTSKVAEIGERLAAAGSETPRARRPTSALARGRSLKGLFRERSGDGRWTRE